MNDPITIQTEHGVMHVCFKFFEVSSITNIKKLFRIILTNPTFDMERIGELINDLEAQIDVQKIEAETFENKARWAKMEVATLAALKPKRKSGEALALSEKRKEAAELKSLARKALSASEHYKKAHEILLDMTGRLYGIE